ncbi:MAG: hypothetical protein E7632_08990 [Ruminococcaceae bacterium]|nr:hypothetical protein [Oscillospiraceae bacterium]
MKLYMKQRWFSWGDVFHIYNPDGSERFAVEGEIFTFGRKLHLYDMAGRELAFVRQELLTFLPRYTILKGDTEIAEVVKEFTFFRHEYTVEGLGWTVSGDFLDHDYEITGGGRRVASVSKEWFTLGDAYEIDIADGVDEIAALAVVLVIDACLDAAKN